MLEKVPRKVYARILVFRRSCLKTFKKLEFVSPEQEVILSDNFRDAFNATEIINGSERHWNLKKHNEESLKVMKQDLGMALEVHATKQEQMCSVA